MTSDAFDEATLAKTNKEAGNAEPATFDKAQSVELAIDALRKFRWLTDETVRPAIEQMNEREIENFNQAASLVLQLMDIERPSESVVRPTVSDSDVVAEDEIEAPAEDKENGADSFNGRAVYFLKIAGMYSDDLDKSHIPELAAKIARLYTSPKARFDQVAIISMYLDGENEDKIAAAVRASSGRYIKTMLRSLYKTIMANPIDIQEPVVQVRTEPESTTPSEPEIVVEEAIPEEPTIVPIVPRVRTKGVSEVPESKLEIAYGQLRKAVEAPARVSADEWSTYGRAFIVNTALQSGFSEEEAVELWKYMQSGQKGEFEPASTVVDSVLSELQPTAVRYVEQRKSSRDNPRLVIYRSAFVNFTQGQSLQATAFKLGQKFPERKNIAARSIVLEIAHLLNVLKKEVNA